MSTWNPFTRIVFRFCFSYFVSFCVLYPQLLFAVFGIFARWLPDDAMMWPSQAVSPIVEWVGRNVFGVDAVLRVDSGSGDQAFFWVLVCCLLVLAVVATIGWSVLDRRRVEYRRLASWFALFIRICLAGQMMFYGFVKVIPTQMPDPGLDTLLRPFGTFAPTGVLWSQVGASPVYQILLGATEVLGGLLLLLPRTALAGALLSMVSMTQVWVLNMTYDVPVKLLSFHLLLLSLVLVAPEARRLGAALLGNAAERSTAWRPTRIVAVAQVVLAVWLVVGFVADSVESWHKWGGGQPHSALYGIWNVDEFTRDGQPVPPLTTDETRWQRVIFEFEGVAYYQRMDDTLVPVPVELNENAVSMDAARFTAARPAPDRLQLTGTIDDRPVAMSLSLLDEETFALRRGGLHLVQDAPDFGG